MQPTPPPTTLHKGDLEFYKIGGAWYETGDVQEWLERVTETPMPATVDSAAIAGIMDVQRCQGCWPLAVRFGYLFAANHTGIHYAVPKFDVFRQVAKVFDKAFQDVLRAFPAVRRASKVFVRRPIACVCVLVFFCFAFY